MQLLMCKSELNISGSSATCSEWVAVDANIIVTPSEAEPIDPARLVLAAGTGVVVVLPLVLVLFGIKMAKKSIKVS